MTPDQCLPKKKPLSTYEIRTLQMLKTQDDQNKIGLTRPEIFQLHGQSQPGVYKSIEKFKECGLIEKIRDPGGKKNSHIISITEKGKKCLECHEVWLLEQDMLTSPKGCIFSFI